jgi:radical SAM superfamily enzyme YgiQ (UPF0313 family)
MRYQGPIYRPPSEADSLLIQATVGCPHNKCTFCTVYKKGPRYKARSAANIVEDLREARRLYGDCFRSIFFPAGNSIAMPEEDLVEVLQLARELFPRLERMTVYGSAKYILEKGEKGLERLARAGLTRIHVGLESGDDEVLASVRKGCDSRQQIEAGLMLRSAGIENSTYVMLGIGGKARSREHALNTAAVVNAAQPDFVRLRTFVPKVNTALLKKVEQGRFVMLGPHEILREARLFLENTDAPTRLTSDHYSNYVDLHGQLPRDREALLRRIDACLELDASHFRPFFVGRG